jgi:anti-sigma regulatory factor (Ser/Thr protein kinase)
MPRVQLEISPTPAHVRTARLVATAVARRSGVADSALDEIRLAVGEACSRAVSLHREYAPAEMVSVVLEDQGKFVVTVRDVAPVGAGVTDADPLALLSGIYAGQGRNNDLLPADFGLAVIGGLVDDLEVVPVEPGTIVRMTWPVVRPAA